MATTSPNMGLQVPMFGDPSPGYATNIGASFTTVDAHDHSSGKGLPITPAGMNINADLPLGGCNTLNARSYRMLNNGAALVLAADKNAVYASGGNLYFNNATGTAVQITSGNGLNASATGGIGGNYVASGANVTYDDTNKIYNFFQSGGTVFSTMGSGNLFVKSTTPLVDFKDVNAGNYYAWRVSASNENLMRWSIDSNLSGNIDPVSKYYTSTPAAMVLTIPSGLTGTIGALAGLGVNQNPANAGPGGATTTFAVYNGSAGLGGATYTGVFHNPSDSGLLLIGGAQATSGAQKSASLYWWVPSLGTCDWGPLSNSGATNTGGVAGDLSLTAYGVTSVMTIIGVSKNVGIGTPIAANRLAVSGAASVGSSVTNTAAPANGLLVQGGVTCQANFSAVAPTNYALSSSGTLVSTTLGSRAVVLGGSSAVSIQRDKVGLNASADVMLPFSMPSGARTGTVTIYLSNLATAGNITATAYSTSGIGTTPTSAGTATVAVTTGFQSFNITTSLTLSAGGTMFVEITTDGGLVTSTCYLLMGLVNYTLTSMPAQWGA